MKLNELFNLPGSKKKSKRVGRGIGSGKGKTCGSGVKGQKSRSGVAIKGFEGGQMPMIARLPKRGFNCPSSKQFVPLNFSDLARLLELSQIKSGDLVNKSLLVKHGFIKNEKVSVKLLGRGDLTQKLSFDLDAYSVSAKQMIEQIGGKIN